MGFRHFFANFERTYYTEYMYTIPNAAIFLILICYKNVSMGISPFRVRIEKPLEKNSRCRPTAKRWNKLVPIILITFPPFSKIFFYSLARSEPFYELSIFPVLWQFVTRAVCHYNPWCFFSSACYFFPKRCAATVFDTFWAPAEKFVVIPSVPYMVSN